MKHKKTAQSSHDRIQGLLKQIREYKPARGEFDYAERGRAVNEAQYLFKETSWLARQFPVNEDLPKASATAQQLWYTAMEAAYPPGFWEDAQKLRAGDAAGLESVISFLEADPMFFRTGYEKVLLMRAIKPPMLKPSDIKRLHGVILSLVDRRYERDFRELCRLALKVNTPELREQLTRRTAGNNPNISRRAQWVLEALARKNSMEQCRKKPAEKK